MTSLILKTIIRVLIIFLPGISLSYVKDTYSQQPESIVILGVGVMVILGIITGFIWWGRKARDARSRKTKNITAVPAAAKRNH